MRLNKLTLARYGHFTDFTFNFGKKTDCDLHIIYGPNEAGKSTTLSAVIDLLYGIPKISDYKFLHSNETLQIDALLEQGRNALEVKRFKKHLTNNAGQKIPDSNIDRHGLTRDEYRLRFSSDEESLSKGGEAILESDGDLGSALYSATSGISSFSSKLNDLMEPYNSFYLPPKARKMELVDLNKRLTEIDRQRKDIDISAHAWQQRQQEADEKRTLWQEQRERTDALQAQLDALTRQQQAVVFKQRIDNANAKIRAFPDFPDLPRSWLKTTRELAKEQFSRDSNKERLTTELRELNNKMTELEDHQYLSIHTETLNNLHSNLALYKQRADEIIALSARSTKLNDARNRLRQTMGLSPSDTVEKLSITPANKVLLEQLLAQSSTVIAEFDTATKEHASASSELAAIDYNETTTTINIEELQNMLAAIQNKAASSECKQLGKQIIALEAELTESLNKLNPWRGTAEQLLDCDVPASSHLMNLAQAQAESINSLNAQQSALQSAQQDLADFEKALANGTDQTHSIDLQACISERNAHWTAHLETIDDELLTSEQQKTARQYALSQQMLDKAYIESIKLAEQHGQTRLQESQRLSQISKIESIQSTITQLDKQDQKTATEVTDVANSLRLPPNITAKEIQSWLEKRESSLSLLGRRQQTQSELVSIEKDMKEDCDRLKSLINTAINNGADHHAPDNQSGNVVTDLELLTAQAQNMIQSEIERNNRISQLRQQHKQLSLALQKREQALTKAEKAFELWQSRWHESLENSWINERDPEQVRAQLTTLNELELTQQQCIDTAAELNELTELQNQYETSATTVITDLRNNDRWPSEKNNSFADSINALLQLNKAAQAARLEANSLTSQIKDKEKQLSSLSIDSAPVLKQLQSMSAEAGASTVAELEKRLEAADEKHALQQTIKDAENDLMQALKVDSVDEAYTQLSKAKQSDSETQIDELELELADNKRKRDDLHFAYRTAQDELDNFQSDATVAELSQQRQNLLLEIKEKAIETMQARIGKIAIEEALRLYRNENKSSMMNNAKTVFSQITCNHYIDLQTQPSTKKNQQEDLIGINAAGQSKLTTQMSSGTRAQLYLALRVAAYKDYAGNREPLPFIADDIMEAFDDDRTEATLHVLADMAGNGQVIYLTHHRHLVDIAKAALGDRMKLHNINARTTSTA